MTTLRDAAQQALDYIQSTADYKMGHPAACEVAMDLKEALEQPADHIPDAGKTEPVAADPCPGCRKGGVCRTPICGRLKLPADHPYRTAPQPPHDDTALLRQALEALEYYRSGEDYQPTPASEAIAALKERLK